MEKRRAPSKAVRYRADFHTLYYGFDAVRARSTRMPRQCRLL